MADARWARVNGPKAPRASRTLLGGATILALMLTPREMIGVGRDPEQSSIVVTTTTADD